MKRLFFLLAATVAAIAFWVCSPFGEKQPDLALLADEVIPQGRYDAEIDGELPVSGRHEKLPISISPASGANSIADAKAGWGDLVRFEFNSKGCRTESIGKNSQVPCVLRVVADHPYEKFTDDQLRQISNVDGVAALILGARLGYRRASIEEYQESLETLTAAVALTGHVDALNMLMTHYGVTTAAQYANGELDVGKVSASYVWHKTGFDLGLVSKESLDSISEPLRRHSEVDIQALDASAEIRSQWFRARRLALTGRTF